MSLTENEMPETQHPPSLLFSALSALRDSRVAMEEKSDFEKQRERLIERNRRALQEIGVKESVKEISKLVALEKGRKRNTVRRNPQPKSHEPVRRSSRLLRQPPPAYNDNPAKKGEGRKTPQKGLSRRQGQFREESYSLEQYEALGDHKKAWVLYEDGFENGVRVYSENGKTCHQCRQKTMGKRTVCSKCAPLVRGQFCGDCLCIRYGENVDEALANTEWVCPVCRDICNCSNCRLSKGWAPTGTMHHFCRRNGYKSVAHYLIMTHLDTKTESEAKEEGESSDPEDDPEDDLKEDQDITGKIREENGRVTRSRARK